MYRLRKKAKKEVKSATASTTTTTGEGKLPLKLFEGFAIHGGDFHITKDTLNESPIVPTVTDKKRKKKEKTNY